MTADTLLIVGLMVLGWGAGSLLGAVLAEPLIDFWYAWRDRRRAAQREIQTLIWRNEAIRRQAAAR